MLKQLTISDLDAKPAAPAGPTVGARGTRLVLLELDFEARGPESVDVTAIGFDVDGDDPGARLLLIHDADDDGLADPGEPVLGATDAVLSGGVVRVLVSPAALRVQPFTGVVIAQRGGGTSGSFTVRRIVNNEGVERIFPVNSPKIVDIEVVRSGVTRRAKLYYLRDRVGKARRLRDRRTVSSKKTAAAAEATPESTPSDATDE